MTQILTSVALSLILLAAGVFSIWPRRKKPEDIEGDRIKVTPELREKAVAIQKDVGP